VSREAETGAWRVSLSAAALLLPACGARTGLDALGMPDAAVVAIEAGAAEGAAPDGGPPMPACTAGVRTLVTTASGPDQLIVEGGYLYWHDSRGISRVPTAGGAAHAVAVFDAGGWPELSSFALSSTNVYFGRVGTSDVATAAKSGGAITAVTGTPLLAFPAVAADAADAYLWASGGVGPLYVVPAGADSASVLGAAALSPAQLAIEGTLAYAADPLLGVFVVDLTTGGVTTRLTPTPALALAIDASDVYFSSNEGVPTSLERVPKNGGMVAPLVARLQVGTMGVAATATDVYFADRDLEALRKIVGKDPSNIATLASFGDRNQPIGVAVDDPCVYVAVDQNGENGAIVAVPR
jgi:hypothetical protein